MDAQDGSRGKADVALVAIGASAGGLEPLESFFDAVDDSPNCAFVIVQHLSPDYRSMMNELLARRSSLPILHIDDGMQLETDTVYLNRSNQYVELQGNRFRTFAYEDADSLPHLPIDRFFTSLSSRDWARTVAIVLSGSGSDGTKGAQILHEAGAAVLVQSTKEASFDSMPRSVLVHGAVDRVLDAAAMPAVVQNIFEHGKAASMPEPIETGEGIKHILSLLEAKHDVDFRNYKPGSVNRRIVRRLHLRGHASLREYAEVLATNAEALNELFNDMLIGVTAFYRDTDAIKALRLNVLDKLAAETETTVPIKIWVPACASGEEVYTIAIEMNEAIEAAGSERRFRIIGTDVHVGSIEIASRGLYPEEKLSRVPPELRDKYFQRTPAGYMINPALRQKIIFSTHNLVRDPPFMNLDLVSCRNLLIYLEDEPQASAISMFVFSLLKRGYLFLGSSESVGKFKSAFEVVDARWRIFRKITPSGRLSKEMLRSRRILAVPRGTPAFGSNNAGSTYTPKFNMLRSRELLVRSYDILLKRYAPSSILLTPDAQVLNWFGAASKVIDTMNNLAEWTVQDIVHPDLHFPINVGIEKLRLGQFTPHARSVTLNFADEGPQVCEVEIETLSDGPGDTLILVKLDFDRPVPERAKIEPAQGEVLLDDASVLNKRVHMLERDLRLTEETLQHVTERLEASGEELQASNEELQASNEELQASNEELQSSNEELHAVNEELVSVSAEHERKIVMLSELNESTEVVLEILATGVIVVDKDNCLRRFSRLIEQNFLLQVHDVGRSIETVGPRLEFVDLAELTKQLYDTGTPQVVSGTHAGRALTVEMCTTLLDPSTDKTQGAIILIRWAS